VAAWNQLAIERRHSHGLGSKRPTVNTLAEAAPTRCLFPVLSSASRAGNLPVTVCRSLTKQTPFQWSPCLAHQHAIRLAWCACDCSGRGWLSYGKTLRVTWRVARKQRPAQQQGGEALTRSTAFSAHMRLQCDPLPQTVRESSSIQQLPRGARQMTARANYFLRQPVM